MEGDRYGGVCCLLEVPEGCSCQINVLQCTLEGIEIVVGKYIRWKYVPLGYCSGKEAVFVVVVYFVVYSCIGRASLACENEAGGSWGQEVHILHVNI